MVRTRLAAPSSGRPSELTAAYAAPILLGQRINREVLLTVLLWVVLPCSLAAWVFTRRTHTYFYYDEWTLIQHVTFHSNNLRAAFEPVNGYLQVLTYVVYWIQVRLFGAGSHTFVFVVFCVSLVTLHIVLAALLRALGLPALVAVFGAGVVVYFGPGSQNMMFELFLATNFALAFSFAAGWVVMRRPVTLRSAAVVSVALTIAVAWSNTSASLGVVFVATLILFRWRHRLGFASLVLPVLVSVVWILRTGGATEPIVAVGIRQQWNFAVRITLLAAGGLAGNGNDILRHHPAAQPVGATVLVLSAALLAWAAWRRRFSGPPQAALVAGGVAAMVTIASTAHSRAGTVDGFTLTHFNRYLTFIAIFLLVALLPPLFQAVRPDRGAAQPAMTVAVAVALVAVFIANLTPMFDYRNLFESENAQTRALVVQTKAVLDLGCQPGRAPNPNAVPLPDQGPNWSVGLVDALRLRGQLSLPQPDRISPSIRDAVCSRHAPSPRR